MRHNVGHRKLQRTTTHRLAMLKNMVTSLLEHEQIRTTVPKAKECRMMAEKVITLGKRGGLHNVRTAQKIVKNKVVLAKVFAELKDRYATRPGGYTRVIKLGRRFGDGAEVAMLELVDFNTGQEPAKPAKAKKAAPKKKEVKAPEAKEAKNY